MEQDASIPRPSEVPLPSLTCSAGGRQDQAEGGVPTAGATEDGAQHRHTGPDEGVGVMQETRTEGAAAVRQARQPRRRGKGRDVSEKCPTPMTTVMVRNVACRYTREQVLQFLDDAGLKDTYDFLYLPLNPVRRANLGYIFINFVSLDAVEESKNLLNGKCLGNSATEKRCEVVLAHVQGQANILAHFRRKSVMRSMHAPLFLSAHAGSDAINSESDQQAQQQTHQNQQRGVEQEQDQEKHQQEQQQQQEPRLQQQESRVQQRAQPQHVQQQAQQQVRVQQQEQQRRQQREKQQQLRRQQQQQNAQQQQAQQQAQQHAQQQQQQQAQQHAQQQVQQQWQQQWQWQQQQQQQQQSWNQEQSFGRGRDVDHFECYSL